MTTTGFFDWEEPQPPAASTPATKPKMMKRFTFRVPFITSLLDPARRLDDDVGYRNVLVPILFRRGHGLDPVHHVHALDDLAEDAVADVVLGPVPVEDRVVLD